MKRRSSLLTRLILCMLGFMVALDIGIALIPDRPARHTDGPDVIVEVLDSSLDEYVNPWKIEVARRFHHAVVILGHGGDFVQGEWITQGSAIPGHVIHVQDLVRMVQAKYPDRVVILLACNTGHVRLGIPGVYYSESPVWCLPDRAITPDMAQGTLAYRTLDMGIFDDTPSNGPRLSRWQLEPDDTGNVYEFVCEK